MMAPVQRRHRTNPVVVVEDSDEDFETVCTAARLAGVQHDIQRALTGDECVLLLRQLAVDPRAQAALVLLDLNTPQGDGRYALTQLHADAQLNAIPLVVLSTSANPRDVDFCYAQGANAYHVKPVNHGEHLLVLQTLFTYWLETVVLSTDHTLER
jgi:CheY-like chemotaxis protein